MLIIIAIILGIVEGATEFLPVSSTGHLILVGSLLGFKGRFAVLFEVVIQLGAILAVIFYYRQRIVHSLSHLKPGQSGFSFWSKIAIAFIPAAVLGFLTKDVIEKYLFSNQTVALALIIGAILMLLAGKLKKTGTQSLADLRYGQALIIGLSQCMALFPGMSRSASTIIGGMIIGLSLKEAAEFSFFLAIPTMIAATSFSLFHGVSGLTPQQWLTIGIGFIVSFITALIVIKKFLAFLNKHSLKPFAYYRIILAVLILAFLVW